MFSFLNPAILSILAITALFAQQSGSKPISSNSAKPTLDYAYFKDNVQPIFLKKRPGHARCITCHDHGSPGLEPLPEGATNWNDEQSRKQFAMWKLFVVPGAPDKSRLLLHPLAREAGGDRFHAGGRHWNSKSDPEWQILAGWVRGETMGGSK